MSAGDDHICLRELCAVLRKGPPYVRGLQSQIGLHIPDDTTGYSPAYVRFLEKIVALRTFNVPVRDIQDLFSKEVRILQMLRFHTIRRSPTWYLEECARDRMTEGTLLLTGYDLGFPLAGGHIQSNLDFDGAPRELFSGREMGEDVRRALDLYIERLGDIRERVRTETHVLRQALDWSEWAFGGRGT